MTTNQSPDTSSVFTYKNHQFDFATMPVASLHAMARKGITHYLGNEQASKLTGLKEKHRREHNEVMADAHASSLLESLQAEAAGHIAAGTVPSGRAPSADGASRSTRTPLESLMRELALSEATSIVEAMKDADGKPMKMPRGEKTITFGNGETRTREQMIANRLRLHDARIRSEAEKQLKARAKHLANVTREAGGEADELGL